MSDILKDVLSAYKDDVQAQKAGALSFIRSHYLIPQPEVLPPDFSTPLPCLSYLPIDRTYCFNVLRRDRVSKRLSNRAYTYSREFW